MMAMMRINKHNKEYVMELAPHVFSSPRNTSTQKGLLVMKRLHIFKL